MALGSYVGINRQKKDLVQYDSPRFEFNLQKGWNRLLFKVSSYNGKGTNPFKFALRLVDAEPITYEAKNIVWETELSERTNASPIYEG